MQLYRFSELCVIYSGAEDPAFTGGCLSYLEQPVTSLRHTW